MTDPAPDPTKVPFQPAKAKLTIASTDDDTKVTAQYNPKELQIDKNVPWAKHAQANKTNAQQNPKEKGKVHLEFGGTEGRTLQIELLFDQYEQKDRGKPKSVAELIGDLETLASVRSPTSPLEDMRRPHLCIVSWGVTGMPSFRCVINSLSTKYTVFDRETGAPLRATCTVKLQEADILSLTEADSNKTPAKKK